jgi:hypothetical protein
MKNEVPRKRGDEPGKQLPGSFLPAPLSPNTAYIPP